MLAKENKILINLITFPKERLVLLNFVQNRIVKLYFLSIKKVSLLCFILGFAIFSIISESGYAQTLELEEHLAYFDASTWASKDRVVHSMSQDPAGFGSDAIVLDLHSVTANASPLVVYSGWNVALTASVSPATYLDTLLTENFNNASNSWTTINNSSGGTPANAAWTLSPDGYDPDCFEASPAFHSNDNSQFYLSSSCAQGPPDGLAANTILRSPAINTVGYSSLSLDFHHFYRDYIGEGAVEVSTNGTTWTKIVSYTSDQGNFNSFANPTINLDSYIGNPSFYVRFRYTDDWGWYWAIDNIMLSGTKTIDYTYSWTAAPLSTAGLPSGADTPSTANASITAKPTETTSYTVYAIKTETSESASSSPEPPPPP